jgi:cell division septal protein FtsQ
VYSLSGVDGMHIFFVDPAEVQANLLRSPTIASAQVFVDWGDPFVRIVVQEREPALIWEQAGVTIWVDIHGRIMRQREQQGNLLRVSVDTLMDGPPQGEIDPAIVGGAVQLHALVPEIMQLRYHPDYGLGYNDPRGWEVWFGTGTDMPDRMQVYRALIEDLVTSGIQPRAVFAMSPHRVWYTTQ